MLLLTYDLVQNGDSQLNTEIKEALIRLGWSDDVRYQVRSNNRFVNDTTPETTLWKAEGSPEDGINAFEAVCTGYTSRHVQDNLRATGKAVCTRFSDEDWSLLKIE